MTVTPLAFTKLIVDDLDGMVAYYREVCGFDVIMRHQAEIAGEPISEVALGIDGGFAGGLILLRFDNRERPPGGEVLLGFTTEDIHDFCTRAAAAGGTIVEEPHDPNVPGAKLVGFVADPEGHVSEIVQRS